MNNYKLTLIAHHRPEVLERILRVVRHRGFVITEMTMQLKDEKVQLDFSVKSDRTSSLLVNQLVKLYDVETVELI
ncbi:acetolactate synthase small subunit [Cricetibacter osteomyelitidis]|uniref:Acetolactate synthase small subunit n=1 Tax=Cricetibacter osteomyelitidis TaxID=1521931 RepID=A0A4R2SWJ9_9PAST|nr:acetolactate synthase 2 small subunit [Cricetibacter osteomyelitidis]TCP94857.1 acetolactate synthase small subunit [Cricetibacter osteomyelitidis]